jgi:serine/threonine-protein phosphatase 2A regulatory subunit A
MEVNPLELLKEEMESDEAYVRINAMHRLKVVASTMTLD